MARLSVYSVADAAEVLSRELGTTVQPRVLSDAFFRNILDVRQCPVTSGRRIIPACYIPTIKKILLRENLITKDVAPASA